MKMDELTSSSKHTFLELMVAQHNSELENMRIEIQVPGHLELGVPQSAAKFSPSPAVVLARAQLTF